MGGEGLQSPYPLVFLESESWPGRALLGFFCSFLGSGDGVACGREMQEYRHLWMMCVHGEPLGGDNEA